MKTRKRYSVKYTDKESTLDVMLNGQCYVFFFILFDVFYNKTMSDRRSAFRLNERGSVTGDFTIFEQE